MAMCGKEWDGNDNVGGGEGQRQQSQMELRSREGKLFALFLG
jgi:hypothetical protein